MKSVSVILLSYNQADVIELIVKALSQQDYSGEKELIVTDDGSSVSQVQKILYSLEESNMNYKFVSQMDLGHQAAKARNNGIRLAQNDIIIFLDGDMIPEHNFVSKHVENHDSGFSIVSGNRIWIGEYSGNSDINFLKNNRNEKNKNREINENIRRNKWMESGNSWKGCFTCNLSIRRLEDRDLYFNESFIGWGPEDLEFAYRMVVKNGFKAKYDSSIIAYHLETSDSIGNVFRKKTHKDIVNYIKNSFLYYKLCSGLKIKEVFFGFNRLKLNSKNMWEVVERDYNENLEEKVNEVKEWLKNNYDD